MAKLPGIFNDVIGPVMRGPSSSHTAASWRIARVSLEMLNDELKSALVEFDKNGAWATNYREQGTAMGINGGLLGLEMTDDRMKDTDTILRERGISVDYQISNFPTNHTNTVRVTLEGKSGNKLQIIGVSLGGGSFEIHSVNGFPVSMDGSFYELLVITKHENIITEISVAFSADVIIDSSEKENFQLITCKASRPFDEKLIEKYRKDAVVDQVFYTKPVMPLISGNATEMPFTTIDSLITYAETKSLDLGELGMIYEKSLGGTEDSILYQKMEELIGIMEKSIKTGLEGTKYHDRILPQQSHLIKEAEHTGRIIIDSLINNIIENVTAIMESKSAMEVIVANPTAGSCGTVAGALKAIADKLNASNEEKIKAYFAAGIVGAYFAEGPGFAAEEQGCQVECGAAAGMAAAGIVQLMGGTAKQGFDAASMAIQNMIGLVCDPVADRVEVPCLGKNVSAAVNAYSSATMVLAGFDAVIPFDQVLNTVERVGKLMPSCHKCSGTGGLALTEAARNLKSKLSRNLNRVHL